MNVTDAERGLIEDMTDAARTAVQQGLVQATGGNFSAREPGSDRFLITVSGSQLDKLTPEHFSVVSIEGGDVVSGSGEPSSEWKLHQRMYAARTDVNAVVHVHPQFAILLDALKHPLRFLTLDHAYYVGSAGCVPFYPNGSDELADETAKQMKHHNAVVLAHHGCSTVGNDVLMAFRRATLLEEAAKMTFNALLLGDTTTHWDVDGVQLMHS